MNNEKTTCIFVDCHVFDNSFQGTRTYIQGIYNELIQHQNLHFFLGSNNSDKLRSVFGEHSNVTYVKYRYYNKFLRLLVDIPQIIKENKIDFAHFQYIASPFKRCKYIVTTHDVLFIDYPVYFPFFNRIFNTILYKHSAKLADIRLTVSEYSKQKIEQHFGLLDYSITPNAVNEVFFEEYDKESIRAEIAKEFSLKDYIIYVSRWEPRKNQQMILKAFVDLQLYKKHQLLFLGNVTIFNDMYHKIYSELSPEIKKQIITLKNTDFQTMLLLLRGAKASVYPSLAEGFGIPPLESIAAKIPTICSDKTAMSDFNFFNKFYFDPYNQVEFNEKIALILEQNFIKDFEKISHKIKKKYNWKKSAAVLYHLINQKQEKRFQLPDH